MVPIRSSPPSSADIEQRRRFVEQSDIIDVGIEILPMKAMEREMSSGVPYYERDLLNVLRQGRGVPAVPLWMIGVAP